MCTICPNGLARQTLPAVSAAEGVGSQVLIGATFTPTYLTSLLISVVYVVQLQGFCSPAQALLDQKGEVLRSALTEATSIVGKDLKCPERL